MSSSRLACRRLLILAGMVASAGSHADEPLARLLACRAVADPAARLECFDHEAGALAAPPTAAKSVNGAAAQSAPPAHPALPAQSAPPGPAPAGSAENFGLSAGAISKQEVAAGRRPVELRSIQAHITAVSSTVTGVSTFTLDNGQVWREITPAGDLLARPGQGVTVSVGVFHSYWLQTEGGRGCKVTRIL